jgi:hypothetical protein
MGQFGIKSTQNPNMALFPMTILFLFAACSKKRVVNRSIEQQILDTNEGKH